MTPTAKADVGVAALEYSGLVERRRRHRDGPEQDRDREDQRRRHGLLGSHAGHDRLGNELAIGFYADSGFGDTLTAGSGYTQRVNVSNAPDMELLAEDQYLPASGATPNASAGTGASTIWLMATVVLKGSGGASGGASSFAQTSGSAETSITTQTTGTVASVLVAHDVLRPAAPRGACVKQRRTHRRGSTCASVRRAAKITARARARFIFDALLKNLPSSLFCYHGKAAQLRGGWTAWFKPTSS